MYALISCTQHSIADAETNQFETKQKRIYCSSRLSCLDRTRSDFERFALYKKCWFRRGRDCALRAQCPFCCGWYFIVVVAEQILLADKTQVVVGRLRRRRAARRTHAGGSPTGRPTSSQIRAPNNCGDGCEWSEPSSRPVLWAGAALNGPWAPTAMSTKVCSCATHNFFF